MNTSRNVAIIGAGIGREHLDAYLELPQHFNVVVLCDLDESRAKEVLKKSPTTEYTNSLESVLHNPAVDIVDICLPPHMHFETCQKSLIAGKTVICEKPLVSSLKHVDELIKLSDDTGLSVFPVFQYRYGLGGLQMRTLINSGLAGKAYVGTLETHWNRTSEYYAPKWRGTWSGEQGGAVLTHAIHIHDWLSFVFGPVESVYAQLATRVNDIEVEDCAALSLRMSSGALVTSSITLGANNDTSRLRFCFEGLTATSGTNPYAPAEGEWSFVAREPFKQEAIDSALSNMEKPPSGYVGYFTAIANALNGNGGNEVTLKDGRRSLEFVSAVYASSRTKQSVELPLNANHESYTGWNPS